ncbi:MAG: hypothetical protein WA913_17390 [Pricia sp.]
MSKTRMLFTLSALWLFAIVAPSVITLVDRDQTIVVSNLNEEEQQEQGKKNVDEKEIVDKGFSEYALFSNSGSSQNFAFCPFSCIDTTLDIVLPPPEHS